MTAVPSCRAAGATRCDRTAIMTTAAPRRRGRSGRAASAGAEPGDASRAGREPVAGVEQLADLGPVGGLVEVDAEPAGRAEVRRDVAPRVVEQGSALLRGDEDDDRALVLSVDA